MTVRFPRAVPTNPVEWGRVFGDIDTSVTAEIAAAVLAHENKADPHPGYTTSAEATSIADAAITTHLVEADPHPQYTTAAELTAGVNAGISAHVAAVDPHPGYLTPAEGNAAYDAIGAAAAVLAYLPTVLGDYADDSAAAAGGVAVGRLYHTSGAVKIRLT